MTQGRRPIGEILVEMGRITEEDVERTLAYQKEEGGFFGDALVALGLVSAAEVKWGLADQYDLPFVQLRSENIDAEVARRVPAAWAREHLVLPVLSVGDVVTVVLADPLQIERLDDVRRWTGADEVQAALSTPDDIRELIDAVHGEQREGRVTLRELFAEALQEKSPRMGVSVRGDHAVGWFGTRGESSRLLQEGWAAELHQAVVPFLPLMPDQPVRAWDAVLRTAEGEWRVSCHAAGGLNALEWAADVGQRFPARLAGARIDGTLAGELIEAAKGAGAVVRIDAAQDVREEALAAELPLLPALMHGRAMRAVHLTDRATAVPAGVLSLPARPPLAELCVELETFGLEAVTLDLDGLTASDLDAARMIAPLVLMRSRGDAPPGAARGLTLVSRGGELVWSPEED